MLTFHFLFQSSLPSLAGSFIVFTCFVLAHWFDSFSAPLCPGFDNAHVFTFLSWTCCCCTVPDVGSEPVLRIDFTSSCPASHIRTLLYNLAPVRRIYGFCWTPGSGQCVFIINILPQPGEGGLTGVISSPRQQLEVDIASIVSMSLSWPSVISFTRW